MSIEIEAKLRLADRGAMLERLASLDAKPIATFEEMNTFFDDTNGRLKTSDQGLRVRIETHDNGDIYIYVTHKGPRAHGQLKSRSETELVVSDADRAAALMGALGYHPVIAFEKRRQRFELDRCRVELDTLPYIGEFIEIEGPSDDAVMAVRGKLGLADEPLIKASYIALLQDHLRQERKSVSVVRFPENEPATVNQ
ncbi:MAG: class IV adenylate cyclase [Planctomycetota bacterium]